MADARASNPPNGHICAQQETLSRIDGKLDKIINRLGDGDVRLALHEQRIGFLEKLAYGLVGLVLTSVTIGVIGMIMRH